MASSLPLKFWCSLVALLCLATSSCKAEGDVVGIVARALACFSDRYVYNNCQESYRLYAEGKIDVPLQATDVYCDGPCLIETKLVLNCIDNILYNFKFYNGASIQDVRYTLNTGCGHTSRRGDFNIQQHVGDEAYGDYDYGHAHKLSISTYFLLLSLVLALGY